jgi:L,D-transpeptidase ErfK/SrfK
LNRVEKRINSLFFAGAVFICLLGCIPSAWAFRCFIMSPDSTLYGTTRWVKVNENDTLLDIARDFDLGYNQIVAANPNSDPWVPSKGSLALVPLAFVLPQDRIRSGIVVNLAEMRLYYFFSEGGHDYFLTAPIGIGTEGFLTKLGTYNVKSKTPNPTWVVPASIKEAEPDLPDKVLPGPDNPLGDFIFRLSQFEYGIHGTNKPWGIGRRVSHGCIRMYPEDVSALYPIIPVGTKVQVIYEPVKIGWGEGKCWIQVFDDFDNQMDNPLPKALSGLARCDAAIGHVNVDFKALDRALKDKTGVPTEVARLQAP